jgi:O-antigen/teichoic acid export membrane protein
MTENNTNNSHKTILKATGVFGMMQVMKMIIGVVGSKFVAVFLGPIGIGVVGLLNNTLNIIASVSSFGIATVSVREIAVADADENPNKVSETISVLQKMALCIGLFGAIITLIFSKLLSQLTFGNTNYYYWFVILSINFVITSYATIRGAILQGKKMLKIIAISNVISSLLITFCTVVLYYFFKFDGIIWVVLSSSAITLLVNMYYTRNFKIQTSQLTFNAFFVKAKPIFQLGFLLSINVIFGQICTYIIKIYLNGNGASTQILGFYEVSTVILISYVGMIFNAMSIDFYPRLTSVSQDKSRVNELVNNQLEIALLLITPAIILLYLVAPLIIELLYTKDFLPTVLILKAALFAIIIKAIIWPLSYIILAKGNKKQYFKQELVSDFLNVSLSIFFYHFFGLEGIGFALVINYAVYGFYVFYIVKRDYDFGYTKDCFIIIVFSVFSGLVACASVFFIEIFYSKIILGVLLLVSILFSYSSLDKRVGVKNFIFNATNTVCNVLKTIINAKSITNKIVNQEVVSDKAQLYPNPNKGDFTINLGIIPESDIAVSIYDLNEALVFSTLTNKSILNISLQNLATGMYIVKLQGNNYDETVKLIKE